MEFQNLWLWSHISLCFLSSQPSARHCAWHTSQCISVFRWPQKGQARAPWAPHISWSSCLTADTLSLTRYCYPGVSRDRGEELVWHWKEGQGHAHCRWQRNKRWKVEQVNQLHCSLGLQWHLIRGTRHGSISSHHFLSRPYHLDSPW